jgi:hypothetical protein
MDSLFRRTLLILLLIHGSCWPCVCSLSCICNDPSYSPDANQKSSPSRNRLATHVGEVVPLSTDSVAATPEVSAMLRIEEASTDLDAFSQA